MKKDSQKISSVLLKDNLLMSNSMYKLLIGLPRYDCIYAVTAYPDGKHIVFVSWDNNIHLWDITNKKKVKSFKADGTIHTLAITSDGKYIVSGSLDGVISLFDVTNTKMIDSFKGHDGSIHSVAFTPDKRHIVSGSGDKTVKLWDIANKKEIRSFEGHSDSVDSIAITSDGKYIVSASTDKTIKLWDIVNGKIVKTFYGHTGRINSIAITSDGRYIFSGSDDATIKLWSIADGKELESFVGHSDSVQFLSITPNEKCIVSGSWDKTVKLWDIASKKEIRSFKGQTCMAQSVAITSDGKYLAIGGKSLKILDMQTGEEVFQLVLYFNGGWIVASSDHLYNYSADAAKEIKILDSNNQTQSCQKIGLYFSNFFQLESKMELSKYGFIPIDYNRFDAIGKPYKIYAELLDATSQEQFAKVLEQPYVTQGALMPDAHAGYSMPIGGVCSTKDVIVPQFVGFDIGCGMCAYRTDYQRADVQKYAQQIYEKIVETIPLGYKAHKNQQSYQPKLPMSDFAHMILTTIGLYQLGTLGGGNHFIEIGYGANDEVWIVIHSGSRGLGHKIASHYMLQAYLQAHPSENKLPPLIADWEARNIRYKERNPEKYAKSLQKFTLKQMLAIERNIDLDAIEGIYGLLTHSKLGSDYIMDQAFALSFALENRKRMLEVVHTILAETIKKEESIEFDDETRFINRNHNHAEYDPQIGEWIHRKGATHAKKGMMGVIPGNMRDGSFIVRGLGNPDSLYSSSHGAGRVMSRAQAKESVAFEAFEASMKGITGTVDPNTIDESPFAYKDIFEVMALQSDLVEVVEHVRPIINVKDNKK